MRSAIEAVSLPVARRIRLARPAWGPRARYMAGVVILASAYNAGAEVGYQLLFASPIAAIVWLPAGAAIAFLCLGGLQFWPGCWSAICCRTTIRRSRSAPRSGMLEVLVAALLIRRIVARESPLDSLGGLPVWLPGSPPRRRSAPPSARCRSGPGM